MKLIYGLPKRSQDVREARVLGYLSSKLLRESGTSPRERHVLQSAKLNGVGDLKIFSKTDIKIPSLEFANLGFDLASYIFPH